MVTRRNVLQYCSVQSVLQQRGGAQTRSKFRTFRLVKYFRGTWKRTAAFSPPKGACHGHNPITVAVFRQRQEFGN